MVVKTRSGGVRKPNPAVQALRQVKSRQVVKSRQRRPAAQAAPAAPAAQVVQVAQVVQAVDKIQTIVGAAVSIETGMQIKEIKERLEKMSSENIAGAISKKILSANYRKPENIEKLSETTIMENYRRFVIHTEVPRWEKYLSDITAQLRHRSRMTKTKIKEVYKKLLAIWPDVRQALMTCIKYACVATVVGFAVKIGILLRELYHSLPSENTLHQMHVAKNAEIDALYEQFLATIPSAHPSWFPSWFK
jgi:DNA-binding transcriptional MerR regulator